MNTDRSNSFIPFRLLNNQPLLHSIVLEQKLGTLSSQTTMTKKMCYKKRSHFTCLRVRAKPGNLSTAVKQYRTCICWDDVPTCIPCQCHTGEKLNFLRNCMPKTETHMGDLRRSPHKMQPGRCFTFKQRKTCCVNLFTSWGSFFQRTAKLKF